MKKHMTLLSGLANIALAEQIAKAMDHKITPVEIKKFNDGETYVRVLESVRGSHVFVIQPTSPPVNDHLIELLQLVDALKRASAKEITAVIPYYGYARQDRKVTSREPITAKLVAALLERAGVNRVVTIDLHVDQIQGFFDVPVDNLTALPILAGHLIKKKLENVVVVSPDAGGANRARRLAKLLYSDLAIIDKRRPAHGESKIMYLIGEVKDKTAILIDDIIDTAGTICNAAEELKKRGAKDVYICATHPLLSKNAVERLASDDIKEVVFTDSIQISKEKQLDKFKVVSLAPFIAQLLESIYEGAPMGAIVQKQFKDIYGSKSN